MSALNRFNVLDFDRDTKNQKNSDDEDDNEDNVQNINDDNKQSEISILDTTKWRNVSVDPKYKNFSSFNNKKKKIITKETLTNRKKLLCNNMIGTGYCCYGNLCTYAHSLEEQHIDQNRKLAYDILFTNKDLSYINLQENTYVPLYRSLLSLTKLCEREKCAGGYNCKFGACGSKKYHVCIKDLNYGNCLKDVCGCVHLTDRGLKPFYYGTTKLSQQSTFVSNVIGLGNNSNNINSLNNMNGTLLSADFFEKLDNVVCDIEEDLISNITASTDSTTSDVSDECERSIFRN